MLHLLHPAALWTLAALALPLAIHLRRPPSQTVRLGSLRFLENSARQRWRNLRWRELLLVCTRMGLLAALALLLAGPLWTTAPSAAPRRWALLDPTAALAGDSLARWDALRQNGYELRGLATGFPIASAPHASDQAAAPDLWSLLREAAAELPDSSALSVFSPGRLAALRGTRPALGHCKVEWIVTPDLPAETHGDPRATEPSSTVSVLVLHDAEHATDARYIEAAANSLGRRVNVQRHEITADVENAPTTDWVFWLCERPVPEGLAQRTSRLLRYGGNSPVTDEDRIVAPDGEPADGALLWKRAMSQNASGVVWWHDGQDNPLLSYLASPGKERWELFTRFDPGWTDLPATTALPAWLRMLLLPAEAPGDDRRLADPTQGQPSDGSLAAKIEPLAPASQPSRDLHWLLWTLAASAFAAERFLSLRPAIR